MIIFGWGGRKLYDKGAVWAAVCPNCHNQVFFHYLTAHSSFSLFFVPLIPYGRKHLLVCPVCHQARELDDAGVNLVKQAQLLLARVRLNELTEAGYQAELARLRNPNLALLPAMVSPGSSDAATVGVGPGAVAAPAANDPRATGSGGQAPSARP